MHAGTTSTWHQHFHTHLTPHWHLTRTHHTLARTHHTVRLMPRHHSRRPAGPQISARNLHCHFCHKKLINYGETNNLLTYLAEVPRVPVFVLSKPASPEEHTVHGDRKWFGPRPGQHPSGVLEVELSTYSGSSTKR